MAEHTIEGDLGTLSCTDCGGEEFRIRIPLGAYECSAQCASCSGEWEVIYDG